MRWLVVVCATTALHVVPDVTAKSTRGLHVVPDVAQSKYKHVHAFDDGAIACAAELREVFEARFAQPRSSHGDRYFWDPWHVSHRAEDFEARPRETGSASDEATTESLDSAVQLAAAAPVAERQYEASGSGVQYNMLRTPASEYFPPELFEKLCVQLAEVGRARLGCDAFTPPWLALYTDGMEMNWHTDAPHGPWAFVLSLTPSEAHAREASDAPAWFHGGETEIMRPQRLDYWRNFDGSRGLEFDDLLERHDPTPFGRLLCFDGRLPHRVSRVDGTRDPRRGRLVLTGWFSEPRTRADGGLSDGEVLVPDAQAALDDALGQAFSAADTCGLGRVVGFLALQIRVDKDGSVRSVGALCDTLVPDPAQLGDLDAEVDVEDDVDGFANAPPDVALKLLFKAALLEAKFPAATEPTVITVPLSCD